MAKVSAFLNADGNTSPLVLYSPFFILQKLRWTRKRRRTLDRGRSSGCQWKVRSQIEADYLSGRPRRWSLVGINEHSGIKDPATYLEEDDWKLLCFAVEFRNVLVHDVHMWDGQVPLHDRCVRRSCWKACEAPSHLRETRAPHAHSAASYLSICEPKSWLVSTLPLASSSGSSSVLRSLDASVCLLSS
jgi:hypothetical protein